MINNNLHRALFVKSPNVKYSDDLIESHYEYNNVRCSVLEDGVVEATPVSTAITFRTQAKLPKLGLMLIGWGGNNGSTLTAALFAKKLNLSFETKDGIVKANFFGSITQSSTVYIGVDDTGKDVYLPLKDLIPMINPNDIVLDGWDISKLNLYESMQRAKVIDVNLQKQLEPSLKGLKPRKAIFDLNFVALNQGDRADNVLNIDHKLKQIEHLRSDIKSFKEAHKLDKIIVMWTANTERYTNVNPSIHQTMDSLMNAVKQNEKEISPSTLYAIASILEGCSYINGSPQNTFVPGLIEMAEKKGVFIGGDDFKSGQTKFKSVVVDFLINAGIKACSIVSYNHLGNNDGYNLSSPDQFKSKEISKSGVVEDMVASNPILYEHGLQKPDHCVVIKYVPYVGDSKRAMDEYISELMLGGRNTLVVHNTCEDSLLATPLILDLVLLTELCERVTFKIHGGTGKEHK